VATQILLYRFQAHDDPAGSFASGCAARSVLLRARAALSPTNHRLSAGGVPSPAGLVLACPARDQRPCRSRRARALSVEHWRCDTYDGPAREQKHRIGASRAGTNQLGRSIIRYDQKLARTAAASASN
jgi:hypothetical protein